MAGNKNSGRRPGPRALREMVLDDIANGADDLDLVPVLAHVARRIAAAQTRNRRSYDRLVLAQAQEDGASEARPWDGRERRRGERRVAQIEMAESEVAASLEFAGLAA